MENKKKIQYIFLYFRYRNKIAEFSSQQTILNKVNRKYEEMENVARGNGK